MKAHQRLVRILGASGLVLAGTAAMAQGLPPRMAERLDRGVVATPATGGGWLISWRLLASDARGTGFDVYRDGRRITPAPVPAATAFVDPAGDGRGRYTVRVAGGKGPESAPALMAPQGYLSIPLDPPAGGTTPAGDTYSYTANDVSVGDLDGDGRYELILKWDPTNSHDNSQAGYTLFIIQMKGNYHPDA